MASKSHRSTHGAGNKGALIYFAKWFPATCLRSLPNLAGSVQFLGYKEFVYQAYVSPFFTAASDVPTALERRNKSAWEVRVEKCPGIGRLDLILQRMGGVLHEHKWEPFTPQDQ